MVDITDDFGDLYADVQVSAATAINSYINSSHVDFRDDSLDGRQLNNNADDLGVGDGGNAVEDGGNEDEDEDEDEDDDFVVVVNNDDFETKADGGNGNDRIGGDGGGGGEGIGDLDKLNGANEQYKYARQYGSASMATRRDSSSRRDDQLDNGCSQPKRSNCGRFEPTSGFGHQGNSFWLPWYRTIFDVDIGTFEQRPWANHGADMTDYFNFGFEEDSWRSYCQSLDQLHQQSFAQSRNRRYENLRSNPTGDAKGLNSDEFVEHKPDVSGAKIFSQELYSSTRLPDGQVGQAIHVEESSTERQPSMDIKPPRICDSDVVIEITLHDPEEPSYSPKELDDKLEAKSEMSEKGCEQGNIDQETHISLDSKDYEPRKVPTEENILSHTLSSDLRRSHESATMSSGMIEKSCTQTEGTNSELDGQISGKVETFSGGDERVLNFMKDNANSDKDSTDTNPRVAGLDLLSDDDLQSDTISSCSDSEKIKDIDSSDLRKTQNSRRSSPDSVMDSNQGARVDHHRSRVSKRIDTERIKKCREYPSRVGGSIEESWRQSPRKFRRHLDMKSHNSKYNDYQTDKPKYMHARGRSRLHHGVEEWPKAFDFIDDYDEDCPSYKEKVYSLNYYDRRSVENQFRAERKGDSHLQHHWSSEDDINLNSLRERDEDRFYCQRTRRMGGNMGRKEWYLEEREFMFGKEKHLFKNQPPPMSNYCSSAVLDGRGQHTEYHDDQVNKRSKHIPPMEYRYSDCPLRDRYAPSPFNGLQKDYSDQKIEYHSHLRHSRREAETSGRGDKFSEDLSLDLNYPRFIRERSEYQNEEAFPTFHDHHDEQSVYTERWRYSSVSRDDDINQICHRHESNSRHSSAKRSRDVTRPYDNRDTYVREDTMAFIDHDDYFENRRHLVQSSHMDWQEDILRDCNFHDTYDEMLDSAKSIPRHKRCEVKHGHVSGEMTMNTQGMRDRLGDICVAGKSCDETYSISTNAKHAPIGLWCRDPVELQNLSGKKSSGNASKSGSALNSLDDTKFQKHPKEQQTHGASVSEKPMANKALKFEESRDKLSIVIHCDVEKDQIHTEDPNLKTKKFHSGGLDQNGCQKRVNQNGIGCAYDENRIRATMAKMEKRRERFKEPILLKDTDSVPKPQVVQLVEKVDSIGQRPRRKRQWGGL